MRTNRLSEKEIRNNTHKENELRRIIRMYLSDIEAAFKPYIGVKTVKADGESFIKKLGEDLRVLTGKIREEKITPLPGTKYASAQIAYISAQYGSVWLKIRLCFEGKPCSDGGYSTTSAEKSVFIGDIDRNTQQFIKLSDNRHEKDLVEIDPDEQIRLYAETKEAADKAAALNYKLLGDNRYIIG